jgi:hypothetical protein
MLRSPDEFINIHIKKLRTQHTWCTLRQLAKAAFRGKFQATDDTEAACAYSSHLHWHNQHGEAHREEDPAAMAMAHGRREETSQRRLAICRLFASLIERSGKFQSYIKEAKKTGNATRSFVNCACSPASLGKLSGFKLETYNTQDYSDLDAADYTEKAVSYTCSTCMCCMLDLS